jgi:ATP-binding cassette subfamily F protein 3
MAEIDSMGRKMLPAEMRNYLAKFLFTGEDVFRQVSTLSGGERGRLALAKLSLSDANLLLLDEPTNHLDLHTQEVLESVLSNFSGTILLVSHDRYLIDSLATQIWEVDPLGRTLHVFKGSYTEYKAQQVKQAEQQAAVEAQSRDAGSVSRTASVKVEKPSLSKYEQKKIRARLSEIELEVAELEKQQTLVSSALENPPDDPGKVQKLGKKFVDLQSQVETLLAEWADLENQLAG